MVTVSTHNEYVDMVFEGYQGLAEASLGLGSYYIAALNLRNSIDSIAISGNLNDTFLKPSAKLVELYQLIGEYNNSMKKNNFNT